ncbi:MAG: diguanylate cyclase [Nitrospirae bacterium]|nr:diguanylate cyclase [Nitrospirota bacterium]
MPGKNTIRIFTWLMGIALGGLVVIVPFGYFMVSYHYIEGVLETETENIANIITQDIISVNPELWEFNHTRLNEYLTKRPKDGHAEIRRILNIKDELVVEYADKLEFPVITRSFALRDSGVVVGRLDISRTLQPLLRRTGFIALLMSLFASGTFIILRILPIRMLYQSEEALRQSEEHNRNLVDNARDIIFTLSTDGKFTSLNPVFEILTGWSSSEWLGNSFVPLLHPDEVPLVMEMFQRALRGEIPPTFELRILSEQGEYLMFEITSTPFISDGKVISVLGIARDITGRKRIEEHLVSQSCEIAIKNMELSALYKISSAISQTINMQSLFKNILNTITEMDALKVQRQAGIFIVQGERLILTAHLEHSKEFLYMHKNITINDCLCGVAVRTGEIIISRNCHTDCRHTIVYSNMAPHGHIIIPLKAVDRIVGVLYLYLLPDVEVGESVITMLTTVGNQIGIAISNSMLYEETKALSLHDPLTKVANRNLMNFEMDKNIAKAERDGTAFSVIIMDLDNFKKYNDTHGYNAGDTLLVKTANILLNEIRAIDLVARFGGEEFLILLPETELKGAYCVAERIRKSIETDTDVTVSLGIASHSQEMKNAEDLIKKADDALYQAKQKGKNRVEVGG